MFPKYLYHYKNHLVYDIFKESSYLAKRKISDGYKRRERERKYNNDLMTN